MKKNFGEICMKYYEYGEYGTQIVQGTSEIMCFNECKK